MKIDGTKSSSEINKKKEARKTSSGDGAFKSMMSGVGGESHSVGSSSLSAGIASLDALLMAQSTEDPAQKKSKQRMQHRAEDILAKLDDLKIAMLGNKVTVGHMVSIADVVASHREKITDPTLTSILDEIDLRAHVELAKLQRAKSNA